MTPKILREAMRSFILLAILAGTMLPAQAAQKSLMLFGDSLMAGLGLQAPQAFAGQLQAAIQEDRYEVRIVNASVSGDTSAAGLSRLDWSLAEKPDAVLLGLGANDMLRGQSPAQLKANLATILSRLREQDIPVLLLGMRASPSLGPNYVAAFDAVFPDLAQQFGVPLYPFFLEGVALDPALNQPDGIHPNAQGVTNIVRGVLPMVEDLLDRS